MQKAVLTQLVAVFLALLVSGSCTAYGDTPPLPTAVPAAAETAIKQIPVIDIPQTAESIDKVRKFEAEGEKFFAQNMMDRALAKWQEAYGMSIEMKYSEGEGRALTNMCRCYLDRGDWIKAKYLGENAIEVLANSKDTRALGHARVALAQAYFGIGNNESAGEQLAAAIKSMTGSEGADSIEAGKLMNLAANLLMRYNKTKESVQFLQQAATYYGQGGDTSNAIRCHLTVAGVLEQYGLYTASLEESQKAVNVAKNASGDNTTSLISALSSLGNGQYVLCEFTAARDTYEQVLSLMTKMSKTKTRPLSALARANVAIGYAHCLAATGDLELAKETFEACISVFKAAGASTAQAQAWNGLGNVEEQQGNHAKAISSLTQAMELQAVVRPQLPRMQLAILHNLACADARAGLNSDARAQLLAALNILKKHKDPVFEARTYCALAEIYFKLADAQAADSAVKKAIELGGAINDDASLWRDYVIQAKLELAQGEQDRAKASLSSALSFFRSPQAGAFASPDRLSFPTTREDLGEQLVALVARMGMAEQGLLAAEQLKEESFSNDWLKRGGQLKVEDRDVFNDLSLQRAHLHAAESFEPPSKIVKDWQNWLQRFRTLVAQNRSLARMIAPVPNRMSDIMKAVQASRSMFVEYLLGPDSSVVFTIDGSGRLSATVLAVTRKQLQGQVTALLNMPATAGGDPNTTQRERSTLQSLYNELFPTAVRNLMPKNPEQTVCIIPDGVLFNLPFAALVDEHGKFLVESHTLTLACSTGAILDIPPRYADDNSVLVASKDGGNNETNMISGVFQQDLVTKLIGKDADISALREQGRGKMIHCANHFSLLANNPFNSLLPLSPEKDAISQKVTAESLFGGSMPSDLTVWSASSVSVKDTLGNSVKVFSRGLNYAGVRNVILSLWVAPDPERTNELMDFYKHKQSGLNQAQSLRKAEMVSIAKDPSPHAWAAFQLLGPGY
jgi:CHAT domain-containing protein/tetratricopeptide (TPR) repeat protein